MAGKAPRRTSAKATTVAKKADAKPVPSKQAAEPRKTIAGSTVRKPRATNPPSHADNGKELNASALIDARIQELDDWRGKTLAKVRKLIQQADPKIVEEWKWRGTPVWSHNGGVCTGETYKNVVKLTFFKGASLDDPKGLFNSSLDGNVRRAIDIRDSDKLDTAGLKALIRAAVKLNLAGKSKSSPAAAKPRLLSGGNPQIAKGYGDAPVQAYIAALPGWKHDVGSRLDALVERVVPGVSKAVKWNSPLYGNEGDGWFLSMHCFTKYVKVAFFRGTSLKPVPPGESKHKEVRYFDIRENDDFDETLIAGWVKQASRLPGEKM